MNILLYALIILFGSASYIAGIWQILKDRYKPNVFSRVVWLLLAINTFEGVVISKSSKPSIILAFIFLIGNALICILSFWKGKIEFGRLEYVCLGLLIISALVWILFQVPLVNLGIGLVAHFIGALPTYNRVWKDGKSESASFWSLFFIASLLTIVASLGDPIKEIIFPIYFTLFDGSMTFLSLGKVKNS